MDKIKKNIMQKLLNGKYLYYEKFDAENGLKVQKTFFKINVFNGNDCIRISKKHRIYLPDIKSLFDFYFQSVEPEKYGKYNLVDFSKRHSYKVRGYDLPLIECYPPTNVKNRKEDIVYG